MKSENNNPWFIPWFNVLLYSQSIVCATVDSQCLEYLLGIYNFGRIAVSKRKCDVATKLKAPKDEKKLQKLSSLVLSFLPRQFQKIEINRFFNEVKTYVNRDPLDPKVQFQNTLFTCIQRHICDNYVPQWWVELDELSWLFTNRLSATR